MGSNTVDEMRTRFTELKKQMKKDVKYKAVMKRQRRSSKNTTPKRKPRSILKVGDTLLVEKDHEMEVVKRLGAGAFGQVYEVRQHFHNENMVMKIVQTRSKYLYINLNEIEILKFLEDKDVGENLMNHFFSCMVQLGEREVVCHVFEMLQRPLADVNKASRGRATHPEIVRIIGFQIMAGLERLHSLGVTHCDLKPDNIMFVNIEKQKLRLKIIDFGLAHFTDKLPIGQGMQNIRYRAPECHFGMQMNEKIDIWSAACVLVRLFTGFSLFPCTHEGQLARYIQELVSLPNGVERGYRASKLIVEEEDGTYCAHTYEESKMAGIEDSTKDERKIKSIERIVELGYYARYGKATDEETLFGIAIIDMLLPDVHNRSSASEVLKSDFFKTFDGLCDPVNVKEEFPTSGLLEDITDDETPESH